MGERIILNKSPGNGNLGVADFLYEDRHVCRVRQVHLIFLGYQFFNGVKGFECRSHRFADKANAEGKHHTCAENICRGGRPFGIGSHLLIVEHILFCRLFATLCGKSKDVTAELDRQRNSMGAMEEQYSGMAADMGGTVGITSANSNTQNVNYNVDITASGDTPVSQGTADMVADNLADRINAELGGKI
jgi:hypothetical protein